MRGRSELAERYKNLEEQCSQLLHITSLASRYFGNGSSEIEQNRAFQIDRYQLALTAQRDLAKSEWQKFERGKPSGKNDNLLALNISDLLIDIEEYLSKEGYDISKHESNPVFAQTSKYAGIPLKR